MADTNGYNPNFDSISFRNNGAVITSSIGTDDTTIAADIGVLPKGSICMCTDGSIWVMQTVTWTSLTIN